MAASAVRPVAIKIDENIRARVKRLAEARQRTSHWLMREAISQYVEREEKREAFRRDTLKAWEAFRENGLHVTADEAGAWMAQLEQGNDVEPPECHARFGLRPRCWMSSVSMTFSNPRILTPPKAP